MITQTPNSLLRLLQLAISTHYTYASSNDWVVTEQLALDRYFIKGRIHAALFAEMLMKSCILCPE